VFEHTAQRVSEMAKEGFERFGDYRQARAMFIKDYVGQYYANPKGLSGEYPINLVYLAIRSLVPNLVMREGMNKVITDVLAHREYAELLGLALNRLQKQLKMKRKLRAGIVDMCFAFAVFKTSLAASGNLLPGDDDINIDPGQVYTELIDLDDFVFDPLSKSFDTASFLGHRVAVSRYKLLEEQEGWNKDLVLKLPAISDSTRDDERVDQLSQKDNDASATRDMQEEVEIVELWIPEAQQICYIPNPYDVAFDKFLKIQDYYGPDEGPYTFGSLTPPVPSNPLPVAPVGVWRDINHMANRIYRKFMDQADRQKDILLYKPTYADQAQAILDTPDGNSVACDDPSAIQTVSFGGQNPENEKMLNSLHTWFNYMAGNPDQMAGVRSSASTGKATEVQVLQSNASVGIEDMRDIINDVAGDISAKQAWYLHTDPLIELPLTKRVAGKGEIQVWLTPEQRQGDWLEYNFEIVKRSMTVLDPAMRTKRIMEFATNVVPAAFNAGMLAMQQGFPFNVPRYLMQVAEEMGIESFMDEIFEDPTFRQRMQVFAASGPQDSGKAGNSAAGAMQNNGNPMAHNIMTPNQEFNQNAQETAAIGQSAFQGMM